MQTTWREALHPLQRRELLRIRGGLGATVIVFSGHVWLTQDGDQRDIFLGPGESFTLDVAAPALLQALEPAQLMLAEPARGAPPAGRSARAGRGLWSLAARWLGARRPQIEHCPSGQAAAA